MRKKRIILLIAALLALLVLASCMAKNRFGTDIISVTVPAGWGGFNGYSSFDQSGIGTVDPTVVHVIKGGTEEPDRLIKPAVSVYYFAPGDYTGDLTALESWYDNVKYGEDVKIGSHTYKVATASTETRVLTVLLNEDKSVEYDILYLKSGEALSLEDQDVIDIIKSTKIKTPKK